MKVARVACAGAIHAAEPHPLSDGRAGVRLTDGRLLAEDAVVWLPPVEARSIIALGPSRFGPAVQATSGTLRFRTRLPRDAVAAPLRFSQPTIG